MALEHLEHSREVGERAGKFHPGFPDMRRVRVTGPARRDIATILQHSAADFGVDVIGS
jgi:hypothetical protein